MQTSSIALLGTFDVKNYGDLLFPLLAQRRLGAQGYAVRAYSPCGAQTGWRDVAHCFSMAELIGDLESSAAFLVGGGNIIHRLHANLKDYSKKANIWAYPSLWAGAAVLGAIANRPVIWNAPGVPREFSDVDLTTMVHPAIHACDYVSVRDEQSRKFLRRPADVSVTVVPDTAVEIARMWPKVGLADVHKGMRGRTGLNATERYAAIHVKKRSVRPEGEDELAKVIEAFAQSTGLTPLLLPIGPCHGDDHFARSLSKRISIPHFVLADPTGLREIASAIAYADAYVGCSLHGYISAAAYQVPARLVAIPNLIKHRGFLSHIGRECDLVDDWRLALTVNPSLPSVAPPIPDSVFDKVEDHWSRILSIIAAPLKGGYVRRTRFLRHVVRNGLAVGGWDWASDVLVT